MIFLIYFFFDFRYDRQLNYFPRYEDYQKRYEDDYIARVPNNFYMYPNGPYDLPEPRNSFYNNEIDRMIPPPPPISYQMPQNRRIIYYATLPEVVRSPPNVDLRYRSVHYNDYNPNLNDYNKNNFYNSYRSNRSPRFYSETPSISYSQLPTSVSASSAITSVLTEIKDNNKSNVKDQLNSSPIEHRIYSDTINSRNGLSSNNNLKSSSRSSDQSHTTFQDGVDERDQTYFSRNH